MIKKLLLVVSLTLGLAISTYSLENEIPSILMEINSGYAIGINLPNAIPVEMKLVYPFSRFGFTVEGGTSLLFDGAPGCHIFLGPTVFIINNSKFRLSLSLGFDLIGQESMYFGIGEITSFNYSLTKHMYIGINLEASYNFIKSHEEIIGYKVSYTQNHNEFGKHDEILIPKKENKINFENYILIKPTLAIGMQF